MSHLVRASQMNAESRLFGRSSKGWNDAINGDIGSREREEWVVVLLRISVGHLAEKRLAGSIARLPSRDVLGISRPARDRLVNDQRRPGTAGIRNRRGRGSIVVGPTRTIIGYSTCEACRQSGIRVIPVCAIRRPRAPRRHVASSLAFAGTTGSRSGNEQP